MLYPLLGVKMDYLLAATRMLSSQKVRDLGELHEAVDEDAVHFISHQWLSNANPDPNGIQLACLQSIMSGLMTGRGESLFGSHAAWDGFIHGVSANTSKAMRSREQMFGTKDYSSADDFLMDVKGGLVWLDFWSIPQLCDTHIVADSDHSRVGFGAFAQQLDDQMKAVNSIPYYIERSNTFWILAPAAAHAEKGHVCDLLEWRRRGWCRLEQWTALLSPHAKSLLLIRDPEKVELFGCTDMMLALAGHEELAPCAGEFACCTNGHKYDLGEALGGLQSIPCDKWRIAPLLFNLYERKLGSCGGDALIDLLLSLGAYAFGGTDFRGPSPSDLKTFEDMKPWLPYKLAAVVDDTFIHLQSVTDMFAFGAVAHPTLLVKILTLRPDLIDMRLNGFSIVHLMTTRPDNVLQVLLQKCPRLAQQSELSASAMDSRTATLGITPLSAAARRGHPEAVKALLAHRADANSRRNDTGETPLHGAAARGFASCCAELLANRADVNSCSSSGSTSAHLAAQRESLLDSLELGCKVAVMDVLLEHRADLLALDDCGRNPLMVAEDAGRTELIELLCEHAGARASGASCFFSRSCAFDSWLRAFALSLRSSTTRLAAACLSFWDSRNFTTGVASGIAGTILARSVCISIAGSRLWGEAKFKHLCRPAFF